MYYVLGSRELVAPASAGAPPLPAQACTSPSILESYAASFLPQRHDGDLFAVMLALAPVAEMF